MSKPIAAWPRWLGDILPLLAWMALIFTLSSQSVLIEVGDQFNQTVLQKTAHMAAYAILTWLWWRALSPERQPIWSLLGWALGLAVLYGISDEIHQRFVPGRHGRVADVLFDAAGGLLMVLLLRRFTWLSRFPEIIWSQPEK